MKLLFSTLFPCYAVVLHGSNLRGLSHLTHFLLCRRKAHYEYFELILRHGARRTKAFFHFIHTPPNYYERKMARVLGNDVKEARRSHTNEYLKGQPGEGSVQFYDDGTQSFFWFVRFV